MSVSKIRFKGNEWAHNPETLKVYYEDNFSEEKLFSGTSGLYKLSSKCRAVNGTGILTGNDCLEQFNALLKLQRERESGILSLPGMKPFYAYFKSLALLCEPCADAVSYSFAFIEDSLKNSIRADKYYHTVCNDENLWDIGYRYGVDVHTLVQLNPEIKRTDELEIGSQVRIC